MTRADARILAGLERRGIADPGRVRVEPWGIGTFTDRRRPAAGGWTLLFYRERPDDNPYAKPVHGLHAIVDLDDMTVLRVEDTGPVPLPPGSGAYAADRVGPLRATLSRWRSSSPRARASTSTAGRSGGSAGTSGWVSTLARAWSCTPSGTRTPGRSGRSCGGPRWRNFSSPLDPRPSGWRNAFDIGEFGIGMLTNSLELGCDCLGEIRYFDVELADGNGDPYTISQAICLHEENAGLLWKHFDADLGTTETRRHSRRLVVSSVHHRGQLRVRLLLVLLPGRHHRVRGQADWHRPDQRPAARPDQRLRLAGGPADAGRPSSAFPVRPPGHGRGRAANTVYEVNTEAVPLGQENPLGNAFRPVKSPLRRESEAQRVTDPARGRYWLVANPNHRTELGYEPAYKLVPGPSVLSFSHPD